MLEKFPIKAMPRDEFPNDLLEIPHPPKELFLRGKFPAAHNIFLAVVGSRDVSDYGRAVCKHLISGLKGYPIIIVSGLALGIDSIAHEEALRAGLTTLAIPGSGLSEKVLYPKTNLRLAQKILENGGCLLSEYTKDQTASAWTFPKRNRLMAGIVKAVLVIEAKKPSGTLITSRMAIDYNKDVLTVPHSIFSKNGEGPLMLLRLGATPVATSEDIVDALGLTSIPKTKVLFEDFSEQELKVLSVVQRPSTRDRLQKVLSLTQEELNSLLTLLEVKGVIREVGGYIYCVN